MTDADKTRAIARAMGLNVKTGPEIGPAFGPATDLWRKDGLTGAWLRYAPLEGREDGAGMLVFALDNVPGIQICPDGVDCVEGFFLAPPGENGIFHAIGDAVIAVAGGEHGEG